MTVKKKPAPPRLAIRLLVWYSGDAFIEDIRGDIDEMFDADLQRMPRWRASARYWLQVISLIMSYSLRRRKQHAAFHTFSYSYINHAMIKNYLKSGIRNLIRFGNYSLVNVTGLAIAIAVVLIIAVFIRNELRYDRFHLNSERIYRLNYEIKYGSNHAHMAATPAMAAHAMQEEFPEIESTVRFLSYGTYLVKSEANTESIKEANVLWTDSTFFQVFTLDVVEGDSKSALSHPYSIAISERMAAKYFNGTSALGKSLLLDNKYACQVTAVYANMPDYSHFQADILISLLGDWPAAREAKATVFSSNNFNTYLLLRPGSKPEEIERKLPGFLEKYNGTPSAGDYAKLSLMPLTDIHLHSNLRGELRPNGNIMYIALFSVVAFLVLAIACINFVNLSTAQSASRAKEIGLRKTMGSNRSQIIVQFLMESTLLTLAAVILAAGLSYLALPVFNIIFARELYLPLNEPGFYFLLAFIALPLGFVAGLYPSFVLSSFAPVNVLKGQSSMQGGMKTLRNGLVVFQFAISIFLIIAALTIREQLRFIQSRELGFEKEHILLVKDVYAMRPNVEAFKNEVEKIPGILSCTITGFVPVEGNSEYPRRDRTFWLKGAEPSSENLVNIQQWSVDTDYIDTYGMEIIAGRNFSRDFPSDFSAVVLNESAVTQFGLGNEPVGKQILTFGGGRGPDFSKHQAFTVIGVVKDFHFSSLKENISSLGLFLGKSDGFLSVRFDGDPGPVLESLEKTWRKMAPGQPFQFSFLDQEFEKMYGSEQRLGKMFNVFAILAIMIACFGLYGLTAYTSQQRTREIGIRKVLGASVASIMLLLASTFNRLLAIAFCIAAPITWLLVEWWLSKFSYKTDISVSVYIVAGLLAFAMAWLTTSHHSYKAASADPVKAIKRD